LGLLNLCPQFDADKGMQVKILSVWLVPENCSYTERLTQTLKLNKTGTGWSELGHDGFNLKTN